MRWCIGLLLWSGLAWGQDAPQTDTPAQVVEVVCPEGGAEALLASAKGLEQAMIGLDETGFEAERHRFRRLFGCVERVLTVSEVAQLHRAMGLIAFSENNFTDAKRAFAALRDVDPTWEPPEALMPASQGLRALFDDAPVDGRSKTLGRLPPVTWWVDGVRRPNTREVDRGAVVSNAVFNLPKDRAFVLQVADFSGGVSATAYQLSPEGLPMDLLILQPEAALRKRKRTTAKVISTVLATGLAVGGGALLGLGLDEQRRLRLDPSDPQYPLQAGDNVARFVSGANGKVGAGAGMLGAAALTLGLGYGVRW